MTVADLSPAELNVAREMYAKGSTDQEWTLYLADCKRFGVTPIDKKLHFQVRKSKKNDGTWERRYAPVTSIDYMREVAEATGKYKESRKPIYEVSSDPQNPYPQSAEKTIVKLTAGQAGEFTAVAYWDEYYPGDGANGQMWRKMPRLMLAKCAEALALRMGFPGQLAGLYEKAELDQADRSDEPPAKIQRPRPAPVKAPTVTQAESNELWNLAHVRQWADVDLRVFLTQNFGIADLTSLPAARFQEAFTAIDAGPNRNLFHPDQK